jgi:hypothetical protein
MDRGSKDTTVFNCPFASTKMRAVAVEEEYWV